MRFKLLPKSQSFCLIAGCVVSVLVFGCSSDEPDILPKVLETSPADGETLNYLSSLTVVFNKPMNPDTIQITVGGIPGDITFDESATEFVWTLQKWALLLPPVPKLINIRGEDETGNNLTDYQPITVNVFFGEIEAPLIVGWEPNLIQPIDADISQITIIFNEPIDPSEATVLVSIRGDKVIKHDVRWKNDRAEIHFKEALMPNTTYLISFRNLMNSQGFRGFEIETDFTTKEK